MTFARSALVASALVTLAATTAAATPAYVLSNVNLRSGRTTTNDVVVLIPAGSVVEASDCADGWCAVTWQDKSGFTIETALDMSGRPHPPAPRAYAPPPGYVAGPPVYAAPPPPAVYYGPGYYYGPYAPAWGWRRRPWW